MSAESNAGGDVGDDWGKWNPFGVPYLELPPFKQALVCAYMLAQRGKCLVVVFKAPGVGGAPSRYGVGEYREREDNPAFNYAGEVAAVSPSGHVLTLAVHQPFLHAEALTNE